MQNSQNISRDYEEDCIRTGVWFVCIREEIYAFRREVAGATLDPMVGEY